MLTNLRGLLQDRRVELIVSAIRVAAVLRLGRDGLTGKASRC
jgi:hypothetical protein